MTVKNYPVKNEQKRDFFNEKNNNCQQALKFTYH